VYYFETKYHTGMDNYDWLKQMKFKKRVICVCCGSSFFVVITDDYKVYTWGINNDGQLGNSTCTDEFTEKLHEVKFPGSTIGNFSFLSAFPRIYGYSANENELKRIEMDLFCSCQIQILIFWIHFYPIEVYKFLGIKTEGFLFFSI